MKGTWQQCYKSGSGGQQWSSSCTGIRFVLLLGFLCKLRFWSFHANLSEITQQFQDFSRFLFLDSPGGALHQSRFKINLIYLSKCFSPSPTKPHFSLLAAPQQQKVWTANGCGSLPEDCDWDDQNKTHVNAYVCSEFLQRSFKEVIRHQFCPKTMKKADK